MSVDELLMVNPIHHVYRRYLAKRCLSGVGYILAEAEIY